MHQCGRGLFTSLPPSSPTFILINTSHTILSSLLCHSPSARSDADLSCHNGPRKCPKPPSSPEPPHCRGDESSKITARSFAAQPSQPGYRHRTTSSATTSPDVSILNSEVAGMEEAQLHPPHNHASVRWQLRLRGLPRSRFVWLAVSLHSRSGSDDPRGQGRWPPGEEEFRPLSLSLARLTTLGRIR